MIDSNLFREKWFRKLETKYKVLWIYIYLMAENSGIVIEDIETASFHIGIDYTLEEFEAVFKEKIIKLEEGKYFIPDFIINNQGNAMKSNNVALKKVLPLLLSYKLIEKYDTGEDKNGNKYDIYRLIQRGIEGGSMGVENEPDSENEPENEFPEKKEELPEELKEYAEIFKKCENDRKFLDSLNGLINKPFSQIDPYEKFRICQGKGKIPENVTPF